MRCPICEQKMAGPSYESKSDFAITSLSKLVSAPTRVWICKTCTHISTESLTDVEKFYDEEYNISLNSNDEDQIYEIKKNGKIKYRQDHQLDVMLSKITFEGSARVLDYGCAKGAMMRKLLDAGTNVEVSLFDVSRMYSKYWDEFVPKSRQAFYKTPGEWNGTFDVLTSFFVLEHIPEPVSTIRHINALLKPGGVFYGVVPYALHNIGDFIVVDHVNHFTQASLFRFLEQAGFGQISINVNSHRGAISFSAVKGGADSKSEPIEGDESEASVKIAEFWKRAVTELRSAEVRIENKSAAVYGAGFYGVFIYSALAKPQKIMFFVDKSPFLQGKDLCGVPVIPPENINEDLDCIYIGLNPKIAEEIVSGFSNLALKNAHPIFPFSSDSSTNSKIEL